MTSFSMFNLSLYVILGIIVLVGISFLIRKILNERKKVDEFLEKEYVVLSILVPKNNEKTPLAAEQMFASLHGILKPQEDKQEHISFEIASKDKFTQFYITVRKELKQYVEAQVYAQYPSVEIKEVPDYTDVELDGLAAVAAELSMNKEDVYPIKTFQSFEVDPLAGITSVLSNVQGNERIWIQILTRPVDDNWQDKGVQIVQNTRDGLNLNGSIWQEMLKVLQSILKEVFMAILSPPKPEEKKKEEKKENKEYKEKKLPGPVETAMGGIETKIQKLGFETKIRIMSIADDDETANAKMMGVIGVFRQFNTTNLNGFLSKNVVDGHDLLPVFQMRPFGDKGYIFNIEELASIYHLPHVSVETPSIVWAGAKKGEPPANLPLRGIIPDDEMTILAKTNFRHHEQLFGIKRIDRRLHMYSIGKTGTGKSTLMENMIYDDIIHGRGLAVVDPHGQTIDHILKFIPEERVKDVVYLNPADHDCPIGFNLLENIESEQKNIMASGLMSVFLKLWEGTFSARMEYILRNAILALLDYPKATMLGIMRILNDKEYRKMILSHVSDPIILDFFINEYEKYDPKFRTEAIAPIQNKVGQFLSSSTIRNIVGQQSSTVSISEIMDSGKILLVDLSVGKIGEDNSKLLGSMMITKIQLAAMQRAHIPEEQRRDFYLYVDEFQNFATESFAVILSEARKYHLNLILTNQYTAQVPEVVMDAIVGNIGTMVAFRVGAPDAESLAKEFEPVFEVTDLVNQPNRHIYIKMAIDGVTCPAFSADTIPPRILDRAFGVEAVEYSRKNYGRPREEVELEIKTYMTAESIVEAPKIIDPIMALMRVEYKEISVKGGYKWYLGAGEEGIDDETEIKEPEYEIEEPESKGTDSGVEDAILPVVEDDKQNKDVDQQGGGEVSEPVLAHSDVGEYKELPHKEDQHFISSQTANKIAKKARKKKKRKEKNNKPQDDTLQSKQDDSVIDSDNANKPFEQNDIADHSVDEKDKTKILKEGETVDFGS